MYKTYKNNLTYKYVFGSLLIVMPLVLFGMILKSNLELKNDTLIKSVIKNISFFKQTDSNTNFSVKVAKANVNSDQSITMFDLQAEVLGVKDNNKLVIFANNGVYDKDQKSLELKNGVTGHNNKDGLTVYTNSMTYNVDADEGSGSSGIKVIGKNIKINADNFKINNRGKIIKINGRAKLEFTHNNQSERI